MISTDGDDDCSLLLLAHVVTDEAILLASQTGRTSIVRLLISHGASAIVKDIYSKFLLLEVAGNGYHEN